MKILRDTAYPAQTASSPAARFRPDRQEYSGNAATASDRVSISQAARNRFSLSSANPAGEYPLEYYAVPQWQARLFPVELSGKLGAKADELYSKGGNLVGTYDRELAEYGDRLNSHLQALLKNEGIDSLPEYHDAMVVDTEHSERLRQQLQASVAGDPRMTELMVVLGLDFPN